MREDIEIVVSRAHIGSSADSSRIPCSLFSRKKPMTRAHTENGVCARNVWRPSSLTETKLDKGNRDGFSVLVPYLHADCHASTTYTTQDACMNLWVRVMSCCLLRCCLRIEVSTRGALLSIQTMPHTDDEEARSRYTIRDNPHSSSEWRWRCRRVNT